MANSILEKVNIEKAAKNIKSTAGKLNKETMKVSEDIVEGAIEAGQEWTKVMEKAMKTGTTLFGKQQDLMLDALEGIKEQSMTGTKRFGKLVGFPTLSKKVQKVVKTTTKDVKARVEETRQTIDEAYDKAVNIEIVKTVSETVDKVTKNAKSKVEETRQSIDEVLDKAMKTDFAKQAKKEVTKNTNKAVATAKKVTKTATKKTKATAKTTIPKIAKKVLASDDLKKIEGVGPKTESLLNEAGITTYKQLAGTKTSTVQEILTAAGSRYNIIDPATWGKQAKLADAKNWDALTKLQGELKGGKKVAKKK